MKRWSHLHTLASGALGGLLVASNGWLIAAALAAAFVLGLALSGLWRRARALAAAAAAKANELHEAKVATEKARATELRTRTRHRARPKKEQERELERAYVRGATDQLHHTAG